MSCSRDSGNEFVVSFSKTQSTESTAAKQVRPVSSSMPLLRIFSCFHFVKGDAPKKCRLNFSYPTIMETYPGPSVMVQRQRGSEDDQQDIVNNSSQSSFIKEQPSALESMICWLSSRSDKHAKLRLMNSFGTKGGDNYDLFLFTSTMMLHTLLDPPGFQKFHRLFQI